MSYRNYVRDPRPDRVIEDLGGGYTLGCIGGFVCHFGKSMIHSPFNQKFVNSLYFARTRAPALGGSFAAWGGTFSAYDCLSHKFRKKEDSWNAIYAGAATGGTLALRNGLNAAARQAIIGGIFVSVIEGMIFYFSKRAVMTPRDQYMNTIELEKKLSQNPKSIKKKVLAPFSFLKMSKTESKPK